MESIETILKSFWIYSLDCLSAVRIFTISFLSLDGSTPILIRQQAHDIDLLNEGETAVWLALYEVSIRSNIFFSLSYTFRGDFAG